MKSIEELLKENGKIDVEELLGKIFKSIIISADKDRITFILNDNSGEYFFWHAQDCCEHVWIDDIE